MKFNTRVIVGMTVSMEPWQANDRAFRVNLHIGVINQVFFWKI